MIIKNHKELKIIENPHGIQSKKLYDEDHGVIMHLLLHSGEALKPHITPVDVVFYVLEGSPHIMIGEEKIQVEKDSLVASPKDIVHCIYNETNSLVRILVMKLPKPTTATKIMEN